MAENSRPWTGSVTGDCGPYSASDWDDIFQTIVAGDQEAAQGVLLGVDNGLEVTGVASPVSVDTGKAFVNGKYYENDAAKNINVGNPAAATRTDYIVLQSDFTAQTVRAVLLQNGAEGTGTPPALTQVDSTKWEIPLARLDVTVGGGITVTDARTYCQFATEVDTAQLADDAVTNAKVADDAVNTDQIVDDAVTADKIDNDLDGAPIGLRASEVSYQVRYFSDPVDTYLWNNETIGAVARIESGDMRGAGGYYGDLGIPDDALGVIIGGRLTSASVHCGIFFCPAGRDPDYFDHTAGQIQVSGQYVEFSDLHIMFGTGSDEGQISVMAFNANCSLWAHVQGYISKV